MFDNFLQFQYACIDNLEYIGSGATRNTYQNPFWENRVIKVPKANYPGYERGQQETEIFLLNMYKDEPFIPKFYTELLRFNDGDTCPIIHMERLRPPTDEERAAWHSGYNAPAWFNRLRDGAQVGWSVHGVLKVYDLGTGIDDFTMYSNSGYRQYDQADLLPSL